MNCYMELCIYNSDERCILPDISIDKSGGCADCILVTIENETLEKSKKNLLEKYANAGYK